MFTIAIQSGISVFYWYFHRFENRAIVSEAVE